MNDPILAIAGDLIAAGVPADRLADELPDAVLAHYANRDWWAWWEEAIHDKQGAGHDLTDLATRVAVGFVGAEQVEWRLTGDLEQAIHEAEAKLLDPDADVSPTHLRAAVADMQADLRQLAAAWDAALGLAEYTLDCAASYIATEGLEAVAERVRLAEVPLPSVPAMVAAPPNRKLLAGIIDLVRHGVTTNLPAFYPEPTEPRDAALARQASIIAITIATAVDVADARSAVMQRRNAEIMDLGLPGLTLTPAQKGAITRRHLKAVVEERGYDRRIPPSPRVLLSGSQGTGKTAQAIEAIAAIEIEGPPTFWFSELTLEKAEEVRADYQRLGGKLPSMVIRGRAALDPSHPGRTMCLRPDAAQAVAKAGLSVPKTLCGLCVHKDICGTNRQRDRIEAMPKGAIYFLAVDYLYLRSCPAPRPDITIVDESAIAPAINITTIPAAEFDPRGLRLSHAAADTLAVLYRVLSSSKDVLLDLRALRRGDFTTSDEMEGAPVVPMTRAELAALMRELDTLIDNTRPQVDGTMADEMIIERIESDRGHRRLVNLRKLASAVAREIDKPRAKINAVTAHRGDITVTTMQRPRIKGAVLAIDGTADAVLNRKLFGETMVHHHVPVERTAFVTGTIGKGYSRQSITGLNRDGEPIPSQTASSARLRKDIALIAGAMPGSVVVFSHKDSIEALTAGDDAALPADTPTGHYNALRGLNSWEDKRSALGIGNIALSVLDLETTSRGFMADDDEPFISMAGPLDPGEIWEAKGWPFWSTRMRRMRDGSRSPIYVAVHPDPRCQRVLEQLREAETVQTPDRVRAIFNHRNITLCNELCLDITYDSIRTHGELVKGGNPLEKTLQEVGFLPSTSPADMFAAHPGRFVSERAAQRALENYPLPSKESLFCDVREVSYRTAGQRGPPSRALIDAVFYPDGLAALRQHLGEITEYQGEKIEQPAAAPRLPWRPPAGAWGFPSGRHEETEQPYARPPTHAPP
jgi:hypothetical protein